MPYTLLIFRCDQDRLERLNEHVRAYQVESVSDVESTWAALKRSDPDAIIAPINSETLHLFRAIAESTDFPIRPLLVLVTDAPNKADLPADLVLPARWLSQALLSELRLRSEMLQMRQKLVVEIDQTHKEQHRRAAQEVDLLKNVIVRTVSHELKTPLLHVKSAVAMLSEDHDRDRYKLIGYATEATARLEGVVRNITQLADSLEIDLEPTQASEAIAQAVRDLRRSWEHKDEVDRVHLNVPDDLPLVYADKQALGVVLQLLIDNALKFSHKQVEVSATVTDTDVTIAVKDRGIGIPHDKIDIIFDPFYQIDGSDARRFGGMGVGLAIVQRILERHHTTIKVDSEVGKGTVFSFALPRAD